jgi:uncharacterized protein YcfJ
MQKAIILVLVSATIAGCASTTPRQIIDTNGVDPLKFERDKAQCETYAAQVDISGTAVDSAAGGALLGAIIGGLLGGKDGAKFGAGYFAVNGAVDGAASALAARRQVAQRCMTARGYNVLL